MEKPIIKTCPKCKGAKKDIYEGGNCTKCGGTGKIKFLANNYDEESGLLRVYYGAAYDD